MAPNIAYFMYLIKAYYNDLIDMIYIASESGLDLYQTNDENYDIQLLTFNTQRMSDIVNIPSLWTQEGMFQRLNPIQDLPFYINTDPYFSYPYVNFNYYGSDVENGLLYDINKYIDPNAKKISDLDKYRSDDCYINLSKYDLISNEEQLIGEVGYQEMRANNSQLFPSNEDRNTVLEKIAEMKRICGISDEDITNSLKDTSIQEF